MALTKIEIEIPEEMKQYVALDNVDAVLRHNALLLYPYILDKTISHGRAAEILGIHKQNLVDLYGQMGFTYFDLIMDELDKDLETFRSMRGKEMIV